MRRAGLGFGLVLLAGLGGGGTAAAQEALGPFLTLEGQGGLQFGHTTQSGNYSPGDPAGDWLVGGLPLRGVIGVRAEAGWDLPTLMDGRIRLGLVVNATGGGGRLARDVAGIVTGQPPPDGQKPEWEINIPENGTPNAVEFRVQQRFWEVMPQVSLALPKTTKGTLRIGLAPFYGAFAETNSSAYTVHHLAGDSVSAIDNALSGQVAGALLTARNDVALSDRLGLFLSGGIGGYVAGASGTITGEKNHVVLERTATISGVRGQLAVGADYRMSPHLSLGTVARLDLWSAFPAITGKYGDWGGVDECSRLPNGDLVCSPPKVVGAYEIAGKPQASVFIGATLTLRP